MQFFLTTLVSCSVSMSVLLIGLLAVTPLLTKRYSAGARYALWKVLLLGLLIPFRPEISFSLVKVMVTRQASLQIGEGAPLVLPVQSLPQAEASGITLWQMAGMLWVCGVFLFLLFHLLRHLRFVKTAARWSEALTGGEGEILRAEQRALGIRRKLGLYRCPVVPGPMLVGFRKPCILLPETDFSEQELRLILRHELIHYKQGDLFVRTAMLLCAAMHWFNPLVQLCAAAVNGASEAACDERVVQGLDAEARCLYGQTILRAAHGGARMTTVFSTNFNGGKKKMKKRLKAVLDTGLKKTGAVLVALALLLCVTSGVVMAAVAPLDDVGTMEIPDAAPAAEERGGIPETVRTEEEDGTLMISPVSGRIDKKGVKAIVDSLKPGAHNLQCVIYDGKYYRAYIIDEGMIEEKMGVYSDPEKIGDVFEQYVLMQQIMEDQLALDRLLNKE